MSVTHQLQRLTGLAVFLAALAAALSGCGSDETRTVLVSQPVPAPATEPDPASRSLPSIPDPSQEDPVTEKGDVVGGGPASGDPDAVVRINAQYPEVPGSIILTDAKALEYIGRLARFFPELNVVMSRLTKVAKCAIDNGVVGARTYIAPDYSHAGAMVVISRLQSQQLPTIAAKCFISDLIGGGPSTTGRFDPCFTSYTMENSVNGVVDRYYIFAGGTNQQWCTFFKSAHQHLNPQPIDF